MSTPLYDRDGSLVGFVAEGGRVLSRGGKSVGWINGNSVYDYRGQHLGWWDGDHMRGHDGGVMAWTPGARNLGFLPPVPRPAASMSMTAAEPMRPVVRIAPFRPCNRSDWSAESLDE